MRIFVRRRVPDFVAEPVRRHQLRLATGVRVQVAGRNTAAGLRMRPGPGFGRCRAGGVDGADEPLRVCGEVLIDGGVARVSGVVADAGERSVREYPPLLGYVGRLLVADGVWREDAFAAGPPAGVSGSW